jgi:hypothetical protein
MDILKALKKEEAKLEKHARNTMKHLAAVRATLKVFGGGWTGSAKPVAGKKRKLSAAGRARISKAAKARWAKIRAAKAKAA